MMGMDGGTGCVREGWLNNRRLTWTKVKITNHEQVGRGGGGGGGGAEHPPPHPALRTQVAYNVEVDAGDEGIAGEYDEAKKQYKVVITKVWRVRAARLVTRRVLQRTTPGRFNQLGDGAHHPQYCHPIPSCPFPPPPHMRLPHLPSPTVDAVRHT